MNHDIKVGMIFEHSWGYGQTNIDFYEVVSITPKTVKVRKIAQDTTEDGFMSGHTVPVPGTFVEPEMRKLVRHADWADGKPYLRFDYGWCGLWDGRPSACSWYR